jgi:two-component system, response regulator
VPTARTILLVEDNPDDIELTLRALRQHQVANEIVVMHDGAEAWDYLAGTGPFADRGPALPPQVILLDLKMPRMGGLQLLERLRADERTRYLPVVVLTSSDEESDMVRSYHLGANSYVRKPVNYVEFSEAVRHLGLYWLLLNLSPGPAAQP